MMEILTDALQRMSQTETIFQPQKPPIPAKSVEVKDLQPESEQLPETMTSGEPVFDGAKTPTVAVDRSVEVPAEEIEGVGEWGVLAESPSGLDSSKGPAEVVPEVLLDSTSVPDLEDQQPGGDETEIEEHKLPIVASVSTIEMEDGSIEHVPEAPATRQTPHKGAAKTMWRPSKWFWAAGFLAVIVIVLGIVLSGILKPGDGKEPGQVAVAATATLKPTRIPLPTSPPEPTEIPGLAAFEDGFTLLHDERKYSEAIEKFNQAEELGFTGPELYTNRAFACSENQYHFGECSYDAALRDFERAFELDPNQAQLFVLRGTYFEHIENWGRAIEDYSRAIELEKDKAI